MKEIQQLNNTDLTWAHQLNQQHATELSSVTCTEFRKMCNDSFYARALEKEAGFLLGFDQSAPYNSPNFLWFKNRLDKFVYIDRVVIAKIMRGQGLAKALYEDLFVVAKSAGYKHICCEINLDPPNPISIQFHQKLGFEQQGKATLSQSNKTVAYFTKHLV